MTGKPVHRPDGGRWADRCICGAEIVFFEGSGFGADWAPGYGCEVLGRPTAAFEIVRAETD